MLVREILIQGRKTNEACADCRVLRFGCPGNREHQHWWDCPGWWAARGPVAQSQRHGDETTAAVHWKTWRKTDCSWTWFRSRFLGWFSEWLHDEVVSSAREAKVVNVRSATVRDVSHSSWCGNVVTQDLLARNTGVAVLHSSNTTATMIRDVWSGSFEGTKWIGVSVSHLSVAVTPHVMRTGKGRGTGTGYSKPYIQPKRRPRDVSWQQQPSDTSDTLEFGRTPEAGNINEARVLDMEFEPNWSADAITWTWSRKRTQWRMWHWHRGWVYPDQLRRHRSTCRCFEFAAANCVLPREVGYCMFPDARESRVAERSEIWEWVELWICRFEPETPIRLRPQGW